MKMNAPPLCAGFVMSFLLLVPNAIQADPFSIAPEFEAPGEEKNQSALQQLMDSVIGHYAPALRARILSLERRFKDMTHFSGSIYIEGEDSLSVPKISGEAALGNEEDMEQPLVNWSVKTSLDFDSGGVGMELWKETGFARISLSNKVEQDFTAELEYKSLLRFEKKF